MEEHEDRSEITFIQAPTVIGFADRHEEGPQEDRRWQKCG